MSGSLRSALRRLPAGRRAGISGSLADGPFLALGLEARPDVTDDDVRAAWRRVATATHPDRADGGDPERFAAAAAAYTALRTRFGRGEALADVRAGSSGRSGAPASARRQPRRAARPRPPGLGRAAGPRWPGLWPPGRPALAGTAGRLVFRVRRGRPGRLALRVLAAFLAGAAAVVVAGGQPAAPALITGAATWLVLTARHDLAPPVPDHGPPAPDPAAPAEHDPAAPAGN
jgi:hypothetical protein